HRTRRRLSLATHRRSDHLTSHDPPTFIQWCMQMAGTLCPWHGGLSRPLSDGPPGALLCVVQSGAGALFYARHAVGGDVDLGRQITEQLDELTGQVLRTPRGHVPGEVPTHFRRWLYENDPDPMNGWLDQRLTDIVLNRGADMIPMINELMVQQDPDAMPHAAPFPRRPEPECERCAFSAAAGGILCVCGHDWGCHGDVDGVEPCKHCKCANMQYAESELAT
ncbi:hypothetical protein V6U90_33275, partial [Micromonospora sp. CPCC 206060]|uniref:hypothetical protein n=1 Tax=Micromonospora sp. CPCC 206060 TaxID=3122406 RepID=UPI002FF42D8F